MLSHNGSAGDCGLPSGANGKHYGIDEQHSPRWESRAVCSTRPLAAVDRGTAKSKALSVGLSNAYFKSLGLPSLIEAR